MILTNESAQFTHHFLVGWFFCNPRTLQAEAGEFWVWHKPGLSQSKPETKPNTSQKNKTKQKLQLKQETNAECQVHQRPARSLCSTHARTDGGKGGLIQLPRHSVTCHLELLRKTLKHRPFDKFRNYTPTYILLLEKFKMGFPMSKNIQENKLNIFFHAWCCSSPGFGGKKDVWWTVIR